MRCTTRSTVLAAAAAAALAAAAPAAQAAFPGENGPITFGQYGPEGMALSSLLLGQAPEPLAATPGAKFDVDVSPDGRSIVYTIEDGEGSGLYVADADGTNERRISPAATSDSDPAWTPDGQSVVFTGDAGDVGRVLMRMHRDGTGRRMIGEGIDGRSPAVSPDGSTIAYVVDDALVRGRISPYEIWTAGIDGADPAPLTLGTDPEWTPDGAELVFAVPRTSLGGTLFTIDLVGGEPEALGTPGPFTIARDPSVSPDGKQVVFRGELFGPRGVTEERDGLAVMNRDGSGQRWIEEAIGGQAPDWGAAPVVVDDREDEPVVRQEQKGPSGAEPRREQAPSIVPAPLTTAARRCASRRAFPIHVRGARVRSARVRVNGKAVPVRRRAGRFVATVDLRTLPKGRFTVRVAKRMAGGALRTEVRRYRTCTPRRTT